MNMPKSIHNKVKGKIMLVSTTLKGAKSSFVSVDQDSLYSAIRTMLPEYFLDVKTYDKSHTKAAASVGGGARVFYTLRSPVKYDIGNGDIVQPVIRIFDQTFPGRTLRVQVGLYRQVCSNGLMAFSADFEPIVIAHTKNKRELFTGIAAAVQVAVSRVEATIEKARQLYTMPVLNPVATVEALELPRKLKASILESLNQRTAGLSPGGIRPQDNVNTVWGLYNFINESDAKSARSPVAAANRDTGMLTSLLAIA
jgi:hypothetical protein